MAEIRAGVETFVLWGTESTFGTEATTIDKQFGFLQTLTQNIRRNLLEYRSFVSTDGGGRSPAVLLPGKFDFNLTADFKPTDFAFLELALGQVSGVGTGGDPFIYTPIATQPSFTVADNYDTTVDSTDDTSVDTTDDTTIHTTADNGSNTPGFSLIAAISAGVFLSIIIKRKKNT